MFETIEAAKKATEELRFPRIKNGKMSRALPYNMHAVRGEPGGKDVQSTSIFVKGFKGMNWTHEDLYAKFCTYGKILSCKVSVDPEHNFLGFGYIQFSKIEEAQLAIEKVSSFKCLTHFLLFRWTSTTSSQKDPATRARSRCLSTNKESGLRKELSTTSTPRTSRLIQTSLMSNLLKSSNPSESCTMPAS